MSIKKKIDLTPHLETLQEKKRKDNVDTNKHLENVSKIMGKNPPNKEQTIQAQKNQRNNFHSFGSN